jgi:2-polyprenyl-3-methyl-5-hydroxy-6-metoxy-1,4-benzoquinol methylase
MGMELTPRLNCVLTGDTQRELLHTFEKFPIQMGCTDEPPTQDRFADMQWWIYPQSGSIQLDPLLPLDVLYNLPHNEAFGGIWQEHHRAFGAFLAKHAGGSVLELGGANGLLAQNVLSQAPSMQWTLLEANPQLPSELAARVKVIRDFVRDETSLRGDWDTVVHSHFFEHCYSPRRFLEQVRDGLPTGGAHVFSMPNMGMLLQKGYSNCLNFEHTCFLHEEFVDWMLAQNGFEIVGKTYFRDHSIFYATTRGSEMSDGHCPNLYSANRTLFRDFVEQNVASVQKLNSQIETANDAPIYLFGAHVFSQFLIGFGLKTERLAGILDNGPSKIGKRLCGTSWRVESPAALRGLNKAYVILKAANYNEEIKSGIINHHNKNVVFWE